MSLQPRDVQDFRFKQLRKLRIFIDDQNAVLQYRPKCALATSTKYGFVFVGCPTGFKVLDVNTSLDYDDSKNVIRSEVIDFPHQHVSLPCFPSHLCLSHDDLMLIACVVKDSCQHALVYDTRAFVDKNQEAEPFIEFRLSSTPGVIVTDIVWSPAVNNVVATCLSDGSVVIYEMNDASFTICASLPPATSATTICWSPKGKQIIIGKRNGSLAQHRPNLQEVKVIASPNIFENPVSVVSVAWLSSFSFAVTYCPVDDENGCPCLVIVNTSKNGNVSFINYDDICYGSGNLFRTSYLMIHQSEWNVILCMSSNSMEVGVLGQNDDKTMWDQWILEDSGRAELPLDGNAEMFPIGMTINYNSIHHIILGENQMLPPMPMLLLLSTNGVLCPFHMISLHPGHQNLVKRIEPLSATGQRKRQASKLSTLPIPGVGLLGTSSEANKPLLPTPNIFSSAAAASMSGAGDKASSVDASRFGFAGQGQDNPLSTSQGSIMTGMPMSTPPQMVSPFGLSTSTPVKNPETFPVQTSLFGNRTSPAAATQPLFGNVPNNKSFVSTISPLAKQETSPSFVPATLPIKLPTVQPPIAAASASETTTPLSTKSSFTRTSRSMSSAFQPTTAAITKNANLSVSGDSHLTPPADTLQTVRLTKSKIETLHLKNVFTAAIVEEMKNFNKELQELKKKTSQSSCIVGTPEELQKLKRSSEELRKFCESIKQLTQESNQEINGLRTEMLETYALFEETQSLHLRNKDPRYRSLLKSRSLDPNSSKKLHHIHQLYHYIDTQIREVYNQMDEVEDRIKTKKKSKGLYLPSIETIYQTILNMQNILAVLPRKIEQLEEKLDRTKSQKYSPARFHSSNRMSSYRSSKGDVDITKLTETLMSTKLSPSSSEAKPKKKLSAAKEAQLRSVFSNRLVIPVRSSAPGNLSRLLMPDISSSSIHLTQQTESLAKDDSKPISISKTPVTTATSLSQLTVTSHSNSFRPVVTPLPASTVSPNAAIQVPIQFPYVAGRGEASAHSVTTISKVPLKPSVGGLGILAEAVDVSSLSPPSSSAKPSVSPSQGLSSFAYSISATSTSPNVTSTSFGFGATKFTPPVVTSSGFTIGSGTKTGTTSFGSFTGAALFTLGMNKNVSSSTFQFKPVESGASKPSAFSFSLDHLKTSATVAKSTASETKSVFAFGMNSASKVFQFGGSGKEHGNLFGADSSEYGQTGVIAEIEEVVTPPSTPVEEIRSLDVSHHEDYDDDEKCGVIIEEISSEESPEEERSIYPALTVEAISAEDQLQSLNITGTQTVDLQDATQVAGILQPQHDDTSTSTDEASTAGSVVESAIGVGYSLEVPSLSMPALIGNEEITITPVGIPSTSAELTATTPVVSISSVFTPTTVGVEIVSQLPESETVAKSSSAVPSPFSTPISTSAFDVESSKSQVPFSPASTAQLPFGSSGLFTQETPPPNYTATSTTSSAFQQPSSSTFSFCMGNQSSFGTTTTTTNTFAGSQPTTVTSVFGGNLQQNAGGSFGFGQSSTAFSSTTTSSTPAPAFGSTTSPSVPVFGPAPVFGQTPAFGGGGISPLMGQANRPVFTQSKPVFGQSGFGAFNQSPNQSSGTMMGTATSPSSFGQGSGGFFSGLGAKPNPENANKNVFSGMAGFGVPSTTTNLFGNQSTGTFSNKFGNTGFGSSSGSFSGGGNSIAQTGFGGFQLGSASPTTPPKPSAFGGASSFGAAPVFSTTQQAFGSSPVFGSQSFGSPPTAASGGAGNFSNFSGNNAPSFGSLAAQTPSPTFGGVAQPSPQPFGASPPTSFGNTSFGSNSSFSGGFGNQNSGGGGDA